MNSFPRAAATAILCALLALAPALRAQDAAGGAAPPAGAPAAQAPPPAPVPAPAAPAAAPQPPAPQLEPAAAAAPQAAPAARQGMMPEIISTFGQSVDDLWWLIVWITLVTFIAVEVLLAVFLIRYRHKEGRRASYTHGHGGLEVVWTVATAAILVFIAIVQRKTWAHIKEDFPGPEKNPYLVRVFGEQFNWHFVYAGPDGKFETNRLEDIFPGDNPIGLEDPKADVYRPALYVPVDTPVIIQLNSLGQYDPNTQKVKALPVLHSFFSPNLRVKQDVVPYHPGKVWFQATKTGTYEIVCAELCGQNHYTMRADMKVLTADELKKALGYDWQAARATEFPETK